MSSNENRLVLKQILKSFSDRGPSCSSTRIKSGSIQEMSKYMCRVCALLVETFSMV